MQLQVEISKFDSLDDHAEQAFNSQLRKLIIEPFADRLQPMLNDLFVELNLDGDIIKELKDTKRHKRSIKR